MGLISKDEFLREYSRALTENRAAAFIGAGFSVGAGFVDWRDLLRDVATDLGLNVDEEHDLIAIAQYDVNHRGTRDRLERHIIRRFDQDARITEAHRCLARLPLEVVWTTNYDKLLEQAFEAARKRVDVKFEVNHLQHLRPYADVAVYKMHGDVSKPSDAVLTKDDYERYELSRSPFTERLRADLLWRQFLFVGFSFTDPNIDYTFNRLRRILGPNEKGSKEHYCIMRPPQGCGVDDDGRHDRDCARFRHRIADLARFGVQVVSIDDYGEIADLLRLLCRRVNSRTVMVSGAAHVWEPLGQDRLQELCRDLGAELIKNDFNIVSGFGLGVSAALIVGAHQQVVCDGCSRLGQRLRLYPFPYQMETGQEKTAYYEANRKEMAAEAGATIFIAGNKRTERKGHVISSPGVHEEFRLAKDHGQVCVPIGATGHAAREIWQEMSADLGAYYPGLSVDAEFGVLGNDDADNAELIAAVLAILHKARASRQ